MSQVGIAIEVSEVMQPGGYMGLCSAGFDGEHDLDICLQPAYAGDGSRMRTHPISDAHNSMTRPTG